MIFRHRHYMPIFIIFDIQIFPSIYFRFVKCEKCSHFFVVLSDADAKNKTARGQMGTEGPDIQNAHQGNNTSNN